jgi:hypothetical protein
VRVIRLRLPEWLWRGRAIRAARERLASSESQRDARLQAREALALGERTEEPSEPFAAGPDAARAAELYREAAHWALVALGRSDESAQPWPESSAEQRSRAAALVTAACADEAALQRLQAQRWRRVSLCLLLLAFGIFRLALLLRDGIELRTDLAADKPWRASSEAMPCDPRARRCGDYLGMSIFFHTKNEPSPWLEIDLGQAQRISRVRVRNRTDCCSALALPLVVELSQDDKTWREVGRRESDFRTWSARFEPSEARWVRLRVDGESTLHLERVSVYR